jgi:hypothetical protein
MQAEPQQEHKWLEQLLGDWTSEMEASMAPGEPPQVFKGTESVRSIGGLWTVAETRGEMPGGGTSKMIMTLGYDPAKKRFVGTFIGSMMTHMWIYDGTLEGNVLTLDTQGESFAGDGRMAKYQDIIEIKSPDHRTLTSQMQGEDGTWTHFMTAHYRRVKS